VEEVDLMGTQLRRFLVFQAFLWWQGGFVFYAAVVVPVGTDLYGAFLQGTVTQTVTDWLALVGLGWHLLFAWDWLAERDPRRRRVRVRFTFWLVSLLLLGGLALVHRELDALLAADDLDPAAFRRWHIAYLWGVTVQWLLALAQAWLTIGVWTNRHPDPAA
jgi:hypothetical protein